MCRAHMGGRIIMTFEIFVESLLINEIGVSLIQRGVIRVAFLGNLI